MTNFDPLDDDDRRPMEPWDDPALADPFTTGPESRAGSDAIATAIPVLSQDRQPVAPANGFDVGPVVDGSPRVIVLDADQQKAIADCEQYRFTNISGTAGVGKTFVAREIAAQPGTVLAATTGIASVNLGEGTTINALLRYFNTESLRQSYVDGHLRAVIRKLQRAGLRRILIDEKSMMPAAQLTYIARAVREVNEGGVYALEGVGEGETDDDEGPRRADHDLPPVGLTLVGDFGQLPPVADEDPATGKKLPVEFCFDSPEWPQFAEHTTILKRIYRQDAQDFVRALHAVRAGDVRTALDFFHAGRFSAAVDDGFAGTTIFAKNESVDRHNLLMLDKVPGTRMTARSIRKGQQRGDWKLIPDELVLKEGALVMILANRREYEDELDDRGRLIYANGDLGTLRGTQGTAWLVELQRTKQVVRVLPVRRENTIPLDVGRRKAMRAEYASGATRLLPEERITEKGKGRSEILGTIDYMPLRAAWGATVHKTQGLTLDTVQVNIRDWMFRQPGMLFVALSRCKTAEGLRIVGDQRGFAERCRVEPRVQKWL